MVPPPPRRPRLPLWIWLGLSHLLALALPVTAFLGSGAFAIDLQRQTRKSLEYQSVPLELLIRAELDHARVATPEAGIDEVAARLQPAIEEFAAATYAGVRIVGRDGRVLASTGPMMGVDLSARPEVREALAGRSGWIQRKRPPEAPDRGLPATQPSEGARVYVATPLRLGPGPDDELVGALLLSRTPRSTWQVLTNMGPRLDLSIAFSLAVTLVMAGLLSWGFSHTFRRLSHSAHRLSEGRAQGDGPWSAADPDLALARQSRIAEVARLADDLGRMADRLQARLHYIAEFAGNVSHEFKTPIATLQGTLELLEDDPDMPAEQRARFLDNAQSELQRSRRLVDGLLALARADQSRVREEVDLDALLRELVVEQPQVSLKGQAGAVMGDLAQLDAAISNLVDNALLHGGPTVTVQLHAFRQPDAVGVEVEDDGPGIPESNQARIFDRFFTTARESGGTGLGLALVKLVAENHGGGVEVQSHPGRTVFRFWVHPRHPSNSQADRTRTR